MNAPAHPSTLADPLVIAGRSYRSRLLVGTGKYRDFRETRDAIVASGAAIVTVAIRRTNIGQTAGEPSLVDALPPSEFTYLPNSAGCYTADDAVRCASAASSSTGIRCASWRCWATLRRSIPTCAKRSSPPSASSQRASR
jgi:thiazole synthase ThiGH ThiG subunit